MMRMIVQKNYMAIFNFSEYFKEQKPDMVTVMADRYEILAPTLLKCFFKYSNSPYTGGAIR